MRRARNPGVVYSGAVGAKMRPPSAKRRPAPIKYTQARCVNGPLAGATLLLESCTGIHTLAFTVKGETGRYQDGHWHPYRAP